MQLDERYLNIATEEGGILILQKLFHNKIASSKWRPFKWGFSLRNKKSDGAKSSE